MVDDDLLVKCGFYRFDYLYEREVIKGISECESSSSDGDKNMSGFNKITSDSSCSEIVTENDCTQAMKEEQNEICSAIYKNSCNITPYDMSGSALLVGKNIVLTGLTNNVASLISGNCGKSINMLKRGVDGVEHDSPKRLLVIN